MAMKVSFYTSQQGAIPSVTNLRATSVSAQFAQYPLTKPELRASYRGTQFAQYQLQKPQSRSSFFIVQYVAIAPEVYEIMDVYPELIGLSFPVGKKPAFSTKIDVHTSGKETATSFWENPKWQFDLVYDYLPNRPDQTTTDYAQIIGFFMARLGSWDPFLFKCPDDFQVTDALIGTGDGVQINFDCTRTLGPYSEPVGQINADTLAIVLQPTAETHTIPAGPPYTVTVDHAPGSTPVEVRHAGVVVNPTLYTVVDGVYTFDASLASDTMTFNYKWTPVIGTNYNVLMPRTVQFLGAPPVGVLIYMTFQFYFVCRFKDDEAGFDAFYDKLYELQSVTLQSLIQ